MRSLLLWTALSMLPGLFLALPHASACSCEGSVSIGEEFKQAGRVAIGTVVHTRKFVSRAEPGEDGGDGAALDEQALWVIKVSKNYKGGKAAYLTIHAPVPSSSCSYNLELNKEYVFWIDKTESDSPGAYYIPPCGRTALKAESAADLRWLNRHAPRSP